MASDDVTVQRLDTNIRAEHLPSCAGVHRLLQPADCAHIPRDAPVAVLLAGPARSLNRTHCSFARHVVEPLVTAGHRVVVFVSTENDAPLDGAGGNSGGGSGGSGDGGDGGGGGGGRGGGLTGSSRDFVPVLERLHREHGVSFEIESSPLTVPPPACVAAIVDRFAPRTLKLHGPRYATELLYKFRMRQRADEMRRRREAHSGVKFAWVVGRGRYCSPRHRTRTLLNSIHEGSTCVSMTWRAIFDGPYWVVFARPDVVFADDIPVDRMCAPSAGRSTAWQRPFSQLEPFCPEPSTVVYTL